MLCIGLVWDCRECQLCTYMYDDDGDDEDNDGDDGDTQNVNERTKLLWILWLYDLFMACVALNGRAFMYRLFDCYACNKECCADNHRSMNGVAYNIIVYGCAIKTINKFGHCRSAAHRNTYAATMKHTWTWTAYGLRHFNSQRMRTRMGYNIQHSLIDEMRSWASYKLCYSVSCELRSTDASCDMREMA